MTRPRTDRAGGPARQRKEAAGRRAGRSAKPTELQTVLTEIIRQQQDGNFEDLAPEPDLAEDNAPFEDFGTDIPAGDEDDWRSGEDEEFDDREPRNQPRQYTGIDIAFWRDASGTVSASVRDFAATGDPDIDYAAALERDRLLRLADALLELYAEAIGAPTRHEAFEALEDYRQEELARRANALGLAAGEEEESKQYATYLSRHRHRVVQIRSGLAPLEFFWWRTKPTTDLLLDMWAGGYREGVQDPVALRNKIARKHKLAPDSVSRHEKALRLVRQNWEVVRHFQAQWPRTTAEALGKAIGVTSRGSTVVQLAICGAFEAPRDFLVEAQPFARVSTVRQGRSSA